MKTNDAVHRCWNAEAGAQEEVRSVVVVYEDTYSRGRAMQACRHLTQKFTGEIEFAFTWWKFKFFEDSEIARAAAQAAARADIILVSARARVDLIREVQLWMESWVRQRNQKPGALAVVMDAPGDGWQSLACGNEALQDLARTAGMVWCSGLFRAMGREPLPGSRGVGVVSALR